MQIESMLKGALALLDQTLIPGSESLKMTAAKNDIQKAIRMAQEIRTQTEEKQEEIRVLREELESRMAQLDTLQEEIQRVGGTQDAEN